MRKSLLLTCILLASAGGASAQDVAGSTDHPIITRYPGSVLRWYATENHLAYRVPVGPVTGYRQIAKTLEIEGRVTRLYYTLDGTTRTDDEVYRNYRDALTSAGFEILAAGYEAAGSRSVAVGSRSYREVLLLLNPWNDNRGAVNEMSRGSATSGGGGTVVGRKVRASDTVYVLASVYRFRADRISTLIDVIEVAAVESGLVSVNAEAIGAGIRDNGRVVLDGLLFDFDKATLQAASEPTLAQIARYLKSVPAKRFFVVGHTDAKGTLSYNQELSTARARSVMDALVTRHQIPRAQLDAHGVGQLVPAFTNASDAGRARNRRVELVEQ